MREKLSSKPRARRGFGRVEKRANGRYRAAYTGPDRELYRAPMTFGSKDDAIAWLSARRAEIEMQAGHRRSQPAGRPADRCRPFSLTQTSGSRRGRPRDASCGRPRAGSTGCCWTSSSTPRSATCASTRSRTRTSTTGTTHWRLDVRRSGPSPTASSVRSLPAPASERPHPLIPYNPAHIRGAGNTKRAHHVEPATLEELRVIVEELPDRYKLMALLAAWCAMRFGELAEVRRGDIDLRTNRVKIRRGVVRVDGEFIIGQPKSDAGVRDVAIPPHLMPLVKDHLSDHTAPGRDALLFPASADENSHMAPSTLYRVYYPAREVAGRKDLRWHDLRHTGAVLAAQTGATLAELMGRLGHTTPGAAMRYQHAAADRDAEIARRLSELADGMDP